MCGIVGAVSLNGGPIDLLALQRMNDLQSHRGPDGEGFMLGWIEDGAFKHSFAQGAGQWEFRSLALASDSVIVVWRSSICRIAGFSRCPRPTARPG